MQVAAAGSLRVRGFVLMKLQTETGGNGSDLFLVHGWCLHSGVWDSLLPELERNYRVTRVDLPGHGRSHALSMPTKIESLARMLYEVAPPDAVWLGWSLGALTCLQAAIDLPQNIRALLLVAATPRFISAGDWPHAMPVEQMHNMVSELQRDYRRTVQRFLALQVRGDAAAQATLRQLRKLMSAYPEPTPANLEHGLQLLRESDLRPELARVHLPMLVVMGGYDRLVPVQAGEYLAAAVSGARCTVIPRAAHAPFLSSPAEFMSAVQQFMQTLSSARLSRPSDAEALPDARS